MAENPNIIVTFTEIRRNDMKPGEKYIIEIESVSKTPKGDIAFIKGFKTLVFDGYGLAQLRRAEEISDAYKRGFWDGGGGISATKPEIDAARQKGHAEGMDDAWSMIRTMYGGMAFGILRRIFNMPHGDATNIVMEIINAFSASEAKKRLDAYEKEKKQKEKQVPVNAYISLGDEVKFNPDNVTVIVTRLGYNFITGIDKHGSVYTYGLPCSWEKTGRHFDLTELFQFMGRKEPQE